MSAVDAVDGAHSAASKCYRPKADVDETKIPQCKLPPGGAWVLSSGCLPVVGCEILACVLD